MNVPSGAGEALSLPLPELTPKANIAACLMVASAVGLYPQSLEGGWLVAERLASTYTESARRSTGLIELAAIQPRETGDAVVNMINDVHRHHGIPRAVTVDEMTGFVSGVAIIGMHRLRNLAIDAACSLDTPVPAEVKQHRMLTGSYDIQFDTMRLGLIGPHSIHQPGALALHNFLRSDSALSTAVFERARSAADTVREGGRRQQAHERAPYAYLHENRGPALIDDHLSS